MEITCSKAANYLIRQTLIRPTFYNTSHSPHQNQQRNTQQMDDDARAAVTVFTVLVSETSNKFNFLTEKNGLQIQ